MDRYNIPKQILSDWLNNYKKYKTSIKTNSYILEGGGVKSELCDIEKDIIFWIIH